MTKHSLHAVGLLQNLGPKRARPPRELRRLFPAVRKVLRRRPGSLWLWCDRNLAQSKRSGLGLFARGGFDRYQGWFLALGGRALVVFKGGAA